MALVSKDPKFIFFHLYKCGGNSLREIFTDLKLDTEEMQGGHGLPSDLKQDFKQFHSLEEFDSYFKFTIVRNPFDFMVSTLFYAKTYANHFMHDEVTKRNMTMEEFIPYYMNVRTQHTDDKIRPFGSNKVVTIKDWLHDKEGNEIMDYVGKLETESEDLPVIFDKLGLPFESLPKKNINQTRVADYQQYYTPKSRAMIEEHFAWELEKFNYKY